MTSLAQLLKGFQFPTKTFALTPQWVHLYLDAVEDGVVSTLGKELVPSLALTVLAIRTLLETASLPQGTLHVGQEVQFHRPAYLGEKFSTRASVQNKGERGAWLFLTIDLQVDSEEGSPVMNGRATLTIPAT